MLTDLSFEVDTKKEEMEVLDDLCKYVTENNLPAPPYWEKEDFDVVVQGSIALDVLLELKKRGQDVLDGFIENMSTQNPEAWEEGMSYLKSSIPMMADVISHNCPNYVTFDNVNGAFKCVPDEMGIRAAVERGEISNSPGDPNAVYTVEGVTYYVKDGQTEWML